MFTDSDNESVRSLSDASSDDINASINHNRLKHLLIDWKLQHKFDTLQDEKITIQILKIMNQQQVEELTSSWLLGDKFLFMFNFKKWRDEQEETFPIPTSSMDTPSDRIEQSRYAPDSSENEGALGATILDILQEHHSGRLLLDMSSNAKCLTQKQRQLLINIIVQYFHINNFHMSLSTSYKLENQILELYPKEKLEYYRTERRGKIYVKFHNSKRALTSVLFPISKKKMINKI